MKSTEVHAIDVHVGAMIRARRKALGMSQDQLAATLSLTFQQVQKYERGANRVSASKLVQIAIALKTDPSFVFVGLDLDAEAPAGDDRPDEVLYMFGQHGGAKLAELFNELTPSNRASLINVAQAIHVATTSARDDRKAA